MATPKFLPHLAIVSANLIGGVSLLAFGLFLFFGPFGLVELNIEGSALLAFDGLLSLGFFVQHSGMIRKSFRRILRRWFAEDYLGAVYAVASGVMLLVLLALWQPSGQKWMSFEGGLRVAARLVFLGAVAGFAWGVHSLRSLDAFGVRPIRARLRGKTLTPGPLQIRGVYRWSRHPLYFFSLLMIWSFPDLTADRILFNVLWTGWIVIATYLEERDLVAVFGDGYRNYQRRVSMLVPVVPAFTKGAAPSNPDTD
jgi:protein-S-isoprenylcysteine O-methyltransferase Ste14